MEGVGGTAFSFANPILLESFLTDDTEPDLVISCCCGGGVATAAVFWKRIGLTPPLAASVTLWMLSLP